MKKVFLILAGLTFCIGVMSAENPEMEEQYRQEQEKCQTYGGGKNAVYKGTTYGTSSSEENRGATWNAGGNGGTNGINGGVSRTSSQQNSSTEQNTNNRWECE